MSKWRAKEWEARIALHEAKVPPLVWEDIKYEMARSEETCIDNFRAYKHGDEEGAKIFKYLEGRGCCGSFTGYTMVDGEKWIMGCNYGHVFVVGVLGLMGLSGHLPSLLVGWV